MREYNINKNGTAVATVLTVYGIETYDGFRFFLFDQVATVLTVYGIETFSNSYHHCSRSVWALQQYLPFTVLKPAKLGDRKHNVIVATVLTVYGIETPYIKLIKLPQNYVATVLTVYGIETLLHLMLQYHYLMQVATVLTVYGIETGF